MQQSRRCLSSLSSAAVKQVSKANFSLALGEIRDQIMDSDFIAVSSQKTGVSSAPWTRILPIDTSETAYLKAKAAAERFELLQFAVCPFKIQGSKILASPWVKLLSPISSFHDFFLFFAFYFILFYFFSCQFIEVCLFAWKWIHGKTWIGKRSRGRRTRISLICFPRNLVCVWKLIRGREKRLTPCCVYFSMFLFGRFKKWNMGIFPCKFFTEGEGKFGVLKVGRMGSEFWRRKRWCGCWFEELLMIAGVDAKSLVLLYHLISYWMEKK